MFSAALHESRIARSLENRWLKATTSRPRLELSRMVLGLHYPSDVLAGAAIGAAIAGLSLVL